MKIAHVIFNLYLGGTETMLLDIIDCQIKLGHDVSLVLINRGHNDTLLKQINSRANVVSINRPIGSKNPWYIIKLNNILAKISPNVVHVHNDKTMSMIVKRKCVKYVGTVHCIGLLISNIEKWDKVFAISQAVKEDLTKRYNCDATIVYNGIKLNLIAQKKEALVDHNQFKIVQIGRLDHTIKGQDIMIKAVGYLKNKGFANIAVDIIGVGPSIEYLKDLAKRQGVSENVNFLGEKSRSEVYEMIKNYDLLVQPSRFEGFGLTVVEGMAAKVPVLVSNNDGPIEIIENNKYGSSFENGDYIDCANKIEAIINNYSYYSGLAQTDAYNRAINYFDIERTAECYIEIYTKKER